MSFTTEFILAVTLGSIATSLVMIARTLNKVVLELRALRQSPTAWSPPDAL